MKRTSKIYYSSYREEKEKEAYNYHVRNAPGVKRLEALLLDGSLISQTKKREYDTKVVVCGDYIQLYKFRKKTLQDKGLEEMKDKKKKKKFDDLDLYKEENYSRRSEVGVVEYKNLLRSRIQLERLIKANEDTWNTFITLTFADNVKDIVEANKKFNIWRTYIKRFKVNFKYVCVPEYQKRGAVHYHLLTNLDIDKDHEIIIPQKDDTGKVLKNRYDVKGWSYGFTRVDRLKDINVISYLSKYMTKESDNRLYSKHRYLNSQNLNKPTETYIDITKTKEFDYLSHLIDKKEVVYTNSYVDYFGDEVNFFEFRSQHNIH